MTNSGDPRSRGFEELLNRFPAGSASAEQWKELVAELTAISAGHPARAAQFRALLESLQEPAVPKSWLDTAMTRIREESRSQRTVTATLSETARDVADVAKRAGEEVRKALQEIVGKLVLDSFEGAALPGIRGTTSLQPRQLMYESSMGHVHLQIESRGADGIEVIGQYLPSEGSLGPNPGIVSLQIDDVRMTKSLDPTGEFRIRNVPTGSASLRIEVGDSVLALDPFVLTSDSTG